jgi:hypothetical protein
MVFIGRLFNEILKSQFQKSVVVVVVVVPAKTESSIFGSFLGTDFRRCDAF